MRSGLVGGLAALLLSACASAPRAPSAEDGWRTLKQGLYDGEQYRYDRKGDVSRLALLTGERILVCYDLNSNTEFDGGDYCWIGNSEVIPGVIDEFPPDAHYVTHMFETLEDAQAQFREYCASSPPDHHVVESLGCEMAADFWFPGVWEESKMEHDKRVDEFKILYRDLIDHVLERK